MQSMGWILRPEGWYYANADGSLVLGWRNINGVVLFRRKQHRTSRADGRQLRKNMEEVISILQPEEQCEQLGCYIRKAGDGADGSGAQAIGWRYQWCMVLFGWKCYGSSRANVGRLNERNRRASFLLQSRRSNANRLVVISRRMVLCRCRWEHRQ